MNSKYIKVDKMRYQTNTIGYLFVFLSLVFSIVALFTLINFDSYGIGIDPLRVEPDYRIGLEIGVGIVLMLVTFLAAEKVRYYDPFWSNYGLFALAGINVLRIFNIPLYAYSEGWIPVKVKTTAIIELAVSALFLVIGGVVSLRKVWLLKRHMKAIDINEHNAV